MRLNRLLPMSLLASLAAAMVVFAQSPEVSSSKLSFVGTTTLAGAEAAEGPEVGYFVSQTPEVDVSFTKPQLSGTIAPARVPADHVPRPSGNPFGSNPFFGFLGITHRNQRFATTGVDGGSNASTEPPDQALAVGNSFVVEAVNSAIAVYDATNGTRLTPFKAMSLFFNQAPEVLTSKDHPPVFGPFLADPRAYFDWDTGHFFVTEVEIDVDPKTGNLLTDPKKAHAAVLVAVSQTNDPRGSWNIFELNVTNDRDAAFGTCPCLGDQPLIGADKFGLYINTNAFSIATLRFRGTQLYAISKQALITGTPPTIDAHRFHNLTQAEGPAFSIQPATVPPNGTFESGHGGTEYFVSSLDFTGTLDDRLTVWALTNTSSLDGTPDLRLTNQVIATQVYGQPPDSQQMPGPTPLRDLLASPSSPFGVFKNHEELVTSNDDRMQQVVFAAGKLWTALNSVVKTQVGPVRTGAAYFILSPSVSDAGQVSATVAKQGYLAIDSTFQNSITFPSIGVNPTGKGVLAFSIVGQDFFPSAGFATLDAVNGAGPIVISALGAFPDDGFTGYEPFGFRSARWGDYSAAVADENGDIWLANEMIPNARRSVFANWGTFIAKVRP